ncbi:MAG TPA: metallophosphoesterase [Thermoanaerobaculia bacterium]|jgi:hypothetical protein
MSGYGPLPAPDPSWPVCKSTFSTPCGLTAGGPPPGTMHFAVIGDWGDNVCCHSCTNTVAEMIRAWDAKYRLDFIITTGDNNYPIGSGKDLVTEMANYAKWSPWPANAPPAPCAGAQLPIRFFPVLGNHDTYTQTPPGSAHFPQLDYFCQFAAYSSPTGNGRYYDYAFPNGLIEIFAINANAGSSEPDGVTANCTPPSSCTQYKWFENAISKSTAAWKIVVFHEPPAITTSRVDYGNSDLLWPFRKWGASVVLMGHQHLYERIHYDGIPWIVNGLGGTTGIAAIRDDQGCQKTQWSQQRFNRSVGAMIGVASPTELRLCFLAASTANSEGTCIDTLTIPK